MIKKTASILILLGLFQCKNPSYFPEQEYTQNLLTLLSRSNRVKYSGTAVKGIVRNAMVKAHSLKSDGSCDTSMTLNESFTDENGNYSLTFNRPGNAVCVLVSPGPRGNSTIYEEKLGRDVELPFNSSFKLQSIIPESRLAIASSNATTSPFSGMIQRRLQFLIKETGSSANVSNLHTRASKEMVIRFGLARGFASRSISNESYPEIDDIPIDWKNPKDPLTQNFISVLVGFSHLANKYKKGPTVSPEDLDSVVQAFSEDFADGKFDGKNESGNSITIGLGTNTIILPSNPLSDLLLPAINDYVREGGKFNVGSARGPDSIPEISVAELAQFQFIDNAEITTTGTIPGGGTNPGDGTTPGGGTNPGDGTTPGGGTNPLPASSITITAPGAGHYSTPQFITISTATVGATIHYTLDGTDPTTSSPIYTHPIGIWSLLGQTKTIKAIEAQSGIASSAVLTQTVGVYSMPPLKTGQTTSQATGDDGTNQTGLTRGYTGPTAHSVYPSDRTTRDTSTGLVWKTCQEGKSGPTCGSNAGTSRTWDTATSDCEALNELNSGNGYAGIKTWRLANLEELATLRDYGVGTAPFINATAFPATVAYLFWSSNTFVPSTANAYYFNYGTGAAVRSTLDKTNTNSSARCVSGPAKEYSNNFTDNGDETVTDNATGLIWHKCIMGRSGTDCSGGTTTGYTWADAITQCNAFTLGGKTWRLPNINELETLINPNATTNLYISSVFITPSVAAFWSSTTLISDTSMAISAYKTNGGSSANSKTGSYGVRCVSGP